ncbi:MAG: selenide, water dikinase SelD [Calditrichia bacterium]
MDEIDKAATEITGVVRRLEPAGSKIYLNTRKDEIKLTHYTHGLGCACKLRPQLLEEVIRKLPVPVDDNVLVGTETADDAAVYRIDGKTAIVQTVDFFTPVVDDPFQFGAIAAANSLSDIYAMGARPLFALNVVGFPSNRLPVEVLEEIMRGAQSKAQEAGISIIGGHTVDDTEPKFGLAVTGIADPEKIIRNSGAQIGDVLILTKPLGTGILSTALKQGLLEKEQQRMLVEIMGALNRDAAEAMQEVGVHACTDITGFGLLGHLLEMIKDSNATAFIQHENVPFLPGVQELSAGNMIPGGTRDNFSYTSPFVGYDEHISENKRLMLNDAQTSGGLLIAVRADRADKLLEKLHSQNIGEVRRIGEIREAGEAKIKVS